MYFFTSWDAILRKTLSLNINWGGMFLTVTDVRHECLWGEGVSMSVYLPVYLVTEMRTYVSLRSYVFSPTLLLKWVSFLTENIEVPQFTILFIWNFRGPQVAKQYWKIRAKKKAWHVPISSLLQNYSNQNMWYWHTDRIDINGIVLGKFSGAKRLEKKADNPSITSRVF